jgi:hypothetical protein
MEKAVHLIPGMTVKINLIVDSGDERKGSGAFINPNTVHFYDGKYYDLIRGYAVEDSDVGTIEPTEDNEPAVLYTHRKPEKNTIYFFSFEEWVESISIVGVPIHDHSSIIQGGPAFGTYFTDDEVI